MSAEAFSAPAVPADAAAYPAEHPSGPGQQPGLCLHRKRRFLLPAAGRQADDRRLLITLTLKVSVLQLAEIILAHNCLILRILQVHNDVSFSVELLVGGTILNLRGQFLLKSSVVITALIEIVKLIGRRSCLFDGRALSRCSCLLGTSSFVSGEYLCHSIGTERLSSCSESCLYIQNSAYGQHHGASAGSRMSSRLKP